MDVKTRLLSNQVHAVDEERRAGNGRLGAKQVVYGLGYSKEVGVWASTNSMFTLFHTILPLQAEVELLKQELHAATSRIGQLSDFTARLSAGYDLSKARRRMLGLLHRAFRGWCHHTFTSRRAKARMGRAERWHGTELLQRRVLRGWFRVAMQLHRGTLRVRLADDLQRAGGELEAQYKGQVEGLRCAEGGAGGGQYKGQVEGLRCDPGLYSFVLTGMR